MEMASADAKKERKMVLADVPEEATAGKSDLAVQ